VRLRGARKEAESLLNPAIRSELPAETHAATREQEPALGRGSAANWPVAPGITCRPGPCDGCYHDVNRRPTLTPDWSGPRGVDGLSEGN
jgi:hypothetical protein